MNGRRQHLENYIIGSMLSNKAYIRDCHGIIPPEEILDPINREIYNLLPTADNNIPVVEFVRYYEQAKHAGAEPPFSFNVLVRMMQLATDFDFDFNKLHYNIHALVEYELGGKYRVSNVPFTDYLNKLIATIYGSNTTT